jgi:hypothetical protein
LSKGLGGTIYTTPVWGEGTLVGMTSGPGGGNAIAVKLGGNGDVTESQRIWRLERAKSGIGSGVIHEGDYFFAQTKHSGALDRRNRKMHLSRSEERGSFALLFFPSVYGVRNHQDRR